MTTSKNTVKVTDFLKQIHFDEALKDENFVNEFSLALAKYCHLLLDIRMFNDIDLRNTIMDYMGIKDIRRYEPYITEFCKLNHLRNVSYKNAFFPGWSILCRDYSKDINPILSLAELKLNDNFVQEYCAINYLMTIIFGNISNVKEVVKSISDISRKIKMAVYGINYFEFRTITKNIKPNYKVQAYFNAIKFYIKSIILNQKTTTKLRKFQFDKNISILGNINGDIRKILRPLNRIISKYYKYRSIDYDGIYNNKYDSELYNATIIPSNSSYYLNALSINPIIDKILTDSKYHIEIIHMDIEERIDKVFERNCSFDKYIKPEILKLKKRYTVRNDTFTILPGKESKEYYTAHKSNRKGKTPRKSLKINNRKKTTKVTKKRLNKIINTTILNVFNRYIKINHIKANNTYKVRITDSKQRVKSILATIEIKKKNSNLFIVKTTGVELKNHVLEAIKEYILTNKKIKFDRTYNVRFTNKKMRYIIKK